MQTLMWPPQPHRETNLIASYLEGNSIRVELEHLTMASGSARGRQPEY